MTPRGTDGVQPGAAPPTHTACRHLSPQTTRFREGVLPPGRHSPPGPAKGPGRTARFQPGPRSRPGHAGGTGSPVRRPDRGPPPPAALRHRPALPTPGPGAESGAQGGGGGRARGGEVPPAEAREAGRPGGRRSWRRTRASRATSGVTLGSGAPGVRRARPHRTGDPLRPPGARSRREGQHPRLPPGIRVQPPRPSARARAAPAPPPSSVLRAAHGAAGSRRARRRADRDAAEVAAGPWGRGGPAAAPGPQPFARARPPEPEPEPEAEASRGPRRRPGTGSARPASPPG